MFYQIKKNAKYQININGDKWIKEININVPLPKEIKAKNMDIVLDDKKLKIAIK